MKNPENEYLHIIVWLSIKELSIIQISSGGHFEFANMAATEVAGSGALKKWILYVLNYNCAKFRACRQICAIFP